VSGALRVRVFPTARDLAQAAADDAAAVLNRASATRGTANAMFATGNSQLLFLEALMLRAVDWARVVVFHMDEYVGIGPDHPAGFARYIRERIEERAHPKTVHYIRGAGDPQAECARYAGLLGDHPLDLCCLGIGENGHLAFNDPPVADFDDPVDVKVVELDRACRQQQVNEGHFPAIDEVPAHAITVTIPALLRAARVLAIAPEARKASPVAAALEGPLTTTCPASVLRTCEHAVLYLDEDSASGLSHSFRARTLSPDRPNARVESEIER
jgi:glucosamine-6-phosphate deaminase